MSSNEAEVFRNSIVKQATPMLCVSDVDAAVEWYRSIGFRLEARYPEEGEISWAAMSFGKASIMLQERGARPTDQIALWFQTDRIEELYESFQSRTGVVFVEKLYEPFYGGRQFTVADTSGFEIVFQSIWEAIWRHVCSMSGCSFRMGFIQG